MKKNNLIKKVQCLCGGIKMQIPGKLRFVVNCHCDQCMKTHGNYATYTRCLKNKIKFLSKKTLRWYKSSNKAKRGFCNKCGASLFFKVIGGKVIHIAAGMFNGPTKLKTINNIFVKEKLDYYKLDSRLPKYNRYPK